MKPCEIYFVIGEYISEGELKNEFEKRGGKTEGIKYVRKPVGLEEMKFIVERFK